MFKTALGGTRYIILIGNIVFKFPYYKYFILGCKQNLREWKYRKRSSYLTKLYFSFPLGICNITERVKPLENVDSEYIKNYFKLKIKNRKELSFILEDATSENFGVKDNCIVKLDWGGFGDESK